MQSARTKQRDPAVVLRLAVRERDTAKVQALLDFLLKRVPLTYNASSEIIAGKELVPVTIIRGEVDSTTDGFPIKLDDATHVVRGILHADEAVGLGVGDKVVYVGDAPLNTPLSDVVAPESVAVLKVWKRAAMAATRARLARSTIDSALLEAASAPEQPQQSPQPSSSSSSSAAAATVQIVELLLKARANVKARDENGWTPLHWAAYNGKTALCGLLLERGAHVEGRVAASHHPSAAEYTPLQLAVIGGHAQVVRLLLQREADPLASAAGGRQLIHLAALGPCADLVEMLCDPTPPEGGRQKLDALSGHGWSALFLAAAADNLPMVKALLALGAPLGQALNGRPLLHHAAACGAASVVHWLGSEFSVQLPIDQRDGKGRTPLRLAARGSHLVAVQVLLGLGASPAPDPQLLADSSISEEVRLLLGAATTQWRRSRSALILRAAEGGDVRAMLALHLEQGVDLMHVDEKGYSALHLAAAGGHEEATLYLLQTPSGDELARLSTRDGGANADWRAEDLARTPRIQAFIVDFKKGDDERNRVVSYARRRLAPYLQQKTIASAQAAADIYAAAAARAAPSAASILS